MNNKFIEYYALSKTDKEREQLMEALFTPDELHMLENRWKVLELLDKEEPQRIVKDKLQVSISTVTKGARVLKYGSGIVQTLLSRKKK